MATGKEKTGTKTTSTTKSAKAKRSTTGKAAASTKASGSNGGATGSSSTIAPKKSPAKRTDAASGGSAGNSARKPASASRQTGRGIVSVVLDKVGSLFEAAQPNAIDLLKSDHRLVEALFQKVKANEDGNNKPVFKKINAELDVHAQIEETVFYPYLLKRGDKELKKIVREGIEEHRQAKMFLSELEKLTGTSEQFKAKLTVLMEDIEHHVKEEENEMFPMVEDQIGEKTLQRLAVELQAEKTRLKKMMARKTSKPAAKRRTAAAGRS